MGFTMARNATYQLRLDEELKQESFSVFHELGITPAEGMRIFLTMVVKTKSIPFAIEHKPNNETIQVIEEAKRGENLVVCQDMDDLFHKLNI
jgi:addiction module RelB/DinJ family antitoxin